MKNCNEIDYSQAAADITNQALSIQEALGLTDEKRIRDELWAAFLAGKKCQQEKTIQAFKNMLNHE